MIVSGSAIIYLNGSTDYVNIKFLQGSGGNATTEAGGGYGITFSGALIRGA